MKPFYILATTILLSLGITARAAIIIVNSSDGLVNNSDGVCSISEAIINANNDAQTHVDCSAGSGADIIELMTNVTLSQAYENNGTPGHTGTPLINSTIELNGNGFILQRDSSLICNLDTIETASEFRILISNGTFTLRNITIAFGCADHSRLGGGLFNQGTLSIINTIFDQNQAELGGGALCHDSGVLSEINHSTFTGNSASDGGAIYNGSTINVMSSTISTIQNSTFSQNSAIERRIGLGKGGAILNLSTITNIQNSTFSENSAKNGGAIYNIFSLVTTIQNSTFSGNLANSGGGAIYNFVATIFTLQNSLFHNNDGPECINDNSPPTGTNNISDKATLKCFGSMSTTLNSNTIASLANNGGATMTHALLIGSQAIDAGDNNSSTSDQRSLAANGKRDIGAYEFEGTTWFFKDGFEE